MIRMARLLLEATAMYRACMCEQSMNHSKRTPISVPKRYYSIQGKDSRICQVSAPDSLQCKPKRTQRAVVDENQTDLWQPTIHQLERFLVSSVTLEGDALKGELGSRGLGSDIIQFSSELKYTPVTPLTAIF